jgi:hypothetical protein
MIEKTRKEADDKKKEDEKSNPAKRPPISRKITKKL